LFAAFSADATINSYYTAALSPAVASLAGIGIVLAWRQRDCGWSWLALAAALLATAAYAAWLLPGSGTGLPGWLRPVLVGLAAAAACALAVTAWRRTPAATAFAIILASAAAMMTPAVASGAVVTGGLGPFQTPFESARETAGITRLLSAGFDVQPALAALQKGNAAEPYLMATQTAVLAAPFIWASGDEVVPIGGFTGTIPAPTLATLQRLIRTNFVRTFLQSPTTTDPRLVWISRHCLHITKQAGGGRSVLPVAVYFCLG
jgi:hypothetical protein